MEPQLGIVEYRGNRSFVMADIPGIIEGASEGKGLGLRFLRHIERNAVLLFMVPADADDIAREYEILLEELRRFNPQLVDKQRVLAISKSDMLDDELIAEIEPTLPTDIPHVFLSSVTGQGVVELKDALWKAITDDANRIEEIPITHRPLDGHHRVSEEDNFIFAPEPIAEEEEDLPDAGGRMIDDIEFDGGEDYIESDFDEDYDDYTDFDDEEDDPQSYESLDDLYEAGPDGQPRLKK
jgi:GTP-binding protein